jgi:hypothetical protein
MKHIIDDGVNGIWWDGETKEEDYVIVPRYCEHTSTI